MVLSRETLFIGEYYRPATDLHPDGDRTIAGRLNFVAQDDSSVETERYVVITNWFEELRERMGNRRLRSPGFASSWKAR